MISELDLLVLQGSPWEGGLQGVSSDYAAIPNFSEAMMGGGEAGGPSGPRSEQ